MLHSSKIEEYFSQLKSLVSSAPSFTTKHTETKNWLLVSVAEQKLYSLNQTQILSSYLVSTSKYGVGSEQGSNKTPLGLHTIANKIGENEVSCMIFKGREATGEIATINGSLDEDVITSRILRLQGEEEGLNKGGQLDSFERYIYIHGTSSESQIGKAASIGCIRMLNADIMALFEKIDEGTPVLIVQG